MSNIDQTEVLVVGAGPVGMFTALQLARNGIKTEVIDQASRSAGHSYSCALHPRTMELLSQTEVVSEAVELGRRINAVGFYEGNSRRAEVKLSDLPVRFPFALVLPQSTLERLLERRLENAGIKIHWNHRLANMELNDNATTVSIEKLGSSAKGFIVPEFETTVEKTIQTEASFVVGADGFNSAVRHHLGIQRQRKGAPQYFVVYEIDSAEDCGHEARIVLDSSTTSVYWPLSDKRCRWSFQLSGARRSDDFPAKDREQVTIVEPPSDHDSLHHLRRLLKERAPWFENACQEVLWAVDVQFEPWLAGQFGKGRCWLAGDAAHQTGPSGMQSMNMGFREAADLAQGITQILRNGASKKLLQGYERAHLSAWNRLLDCDGAIKVTDKTDPWVQQHSARIVGSVPASDEDLDHLLKRLEIGLI